MKPRPQKNQPCSCTKSGPRERADLLEQANDLCAKVKPPAGKGVKPRKSA